MNVRTAVEAEAADVDAVVINAEVDHDSFAGTLFAEHEEAMNAQGVPPRLC